MNEHNNKHLPNLCREINFVSATNEHKVQFTRKNHKTQSIYKRFQLKMSLSSHSCLTLIFTIPTKIIQGLPYGLSIMMCKCTLHPLQAVVTLCTLCCNVNRISAFGQHSVFVFCMILTTNSEYFPTQHQTVGLCIGHAMDVQCVYCEVKTKFLNIILMNVRLQRALCLTEGLIKEATNVQSN